MRIDDSTLPIYYCEVKLINPAGALAMKITSIRL
jgi:hypothetical protein